MSLFKPLSVYIHWPFCKKKCPYCDFNSHVQDSIDHEEWLNAYLNQIDYFRDVIKGKKIKSIFFGGGTPSLMNPDIVEKILCKLNPGNDVEITLEANPTSSDKNKFRAFKAAGINRLSIGIQSFIESDLQFLGREHSASEAKVAINAAAEIFDRYSIDLIYARPKQTIEMWSKELDEALKYAGSHISLYQLTIEKGTPFFSQHKNKVFTMPSNSLAADMYEFTNNALCSIGFVQYEISNYAKPGNECIHNMCYWQYDEFLGIGPGAHSRIKLDDTGLYSSVVMFHKPDKWLQQVTLNGNAMQQNQRLSIGEMVIEYVLMCLRLNNGVDLKGFESKFKHNLNPFLDFDKLRYFASQNLLEYNQNYIKLNNNGKIMLDYIVREILST